MTDSEAFLVAIDRDPDNPLPRLVYADWLEEHAGTETCQKCRGDGYWSAGSCGGQGLEDMDEYPCRTCDGTGHVPDETARLAQGYRALGELRRWPWEYCDSRGMTDFHFYNVETQLSPVHPESNLPAVWWGKTIAWTVTTVRRKSFPTRRAAEDAAALAWSTMTDAEREQCRAALATTPREG